MTGGRPRRMETLPLWFATPYFAELTELALAQGWQTDSRELSYELDSSGGEHTRHHEQASWASKDSIEVMALWEFEERMKDGESHFATYMPDPVAADHSGVAKRSRSELTLFVSRTA